jgi:uncharacterized linocin/CFP29 family protein
MNNMKRIGLATGALTDYEINYIETQVVKTVRPLLIGRTLMPTRTLPNAGLTKYTYFLEADMGAPTISMTGEEQSMDAVDLTESSVKIPIISKDYNLHWRDILARRNNGEDLNTQHATNAARQIAEDEDRLILTGETLATNIFPALGIRGICASAAALGNTEAGGAWPGTAVADVSDSINELETDGYYGPYKLILRSNQYATLRALVGATDSFYFQVIGDLLGGQQNILVSNNLYAADGGTDSGLLIDTSPGNFELLVGADISNNLAQLPTMNYQGKVWEAVVPVIKRPEAACEITDLS